MKWTKTPRLFKEKNGENQKGRWKNKRILARTFPLLSHHLFPCFLLSFFCVDYYHHFLFDPSPALHVPLLLLTARRYCPPAPHAARKMDAGKEIKQKTKNKDGKKERKKWQRTSRRRSPHPILHLPDSSHSTYYILIYRVYAICIDRAWWRSVVIGLR